MRNYKTVFLIFLNFVGVNVSNLEAGMTRKKRSCNKLLSPLHYKLDKLNELADICSTWILRHVLHRAAFYPSISVKDNLRWANMV